MTVKRTQFQPGPRQSGVSRIFTDQSEFRGNSWWIGNFGPK
jgi:hypothetical protein